MSDVPELSSDEDNFEEDDWQEMETCNSPTTCLFCPDSLPNLEDAFKHCEQVHQFNISTLKSKFNMDCYSYIKLINYIKSNKASAEVIMSMPKVEWDDEKYLIPVDNDEWLMFDFESLPEKPLSPRNYHANVENGLVTLSQEHFSELHNTIQSLTAQLKESQDRVDVGIEAMENMKKVMQLFVENSAREQKQVEKYTASDIDCEDDEGYFTSYAHYGIHYDMLADKVRTENYRDAIMKNSAVIKDKVVLDLGCGTGILSMFAAKAGAKSVIALDQSEVVYHAMDIVRENNLHKRIKVVKGKLEKTKFDEKFDVIISEWMGYFLLFEAMLDSVIYARDNYLNPGGLLLPNRCNISLAASGDVETHKNLIDFWSDVYGFKMNCMKSEVIKEATLDAVKSEYIISEACVVKDIDINTCTTDVFDFESTFRLPVTKDGSVSSIVGYFDTFFELPHPVSFSTGPHSTPTHWKQTIFYFRDCTPVKKGDVIEGTILCNRLQSNVRALSVKLTIFGKTHAYIVS